MSVDHVDGRPPRWMLGVAMFGLLVPNGLFLYWLFFEQPTVSAVVGDHLALAFMIDAALILVVFAGHVATAPGYTVGWGWFVVLSVVGGIGFSIPVYLWLNARAGRRPAPRPSDPPGRPAPPPPGA
jgi:hypothetical protein